MILKPLVFVVTLLFLSLGAGAEPSTPTVDEIVRRAVERRDKEAQICSVYSCLATAQKIKYNREFQPEKTTTIGKKVYQISRRIAEVVFSIEEEGVMLDSGEVEERIREMEKKWEKREKENKEQGSREDFDDPLTQEHALDYDFKVIGTGDSTYDVISATISPAEDRRDPRTESSDQSVERLLSYYIIEVKSGIRDKRHIDATYWIDQNDFGILKTTFAPSKLPSFVDLLQFRIDYLTVQHNGEKLHLPGRFELTGKAGFLFFKGRFGVIEEYRDYLCGDSLPPDQFERRFFHGKAQREE